MSPKEATPGRVLLAFATVYVIWGSTYLAIRLAIETLPPFTMAGTRFLIAGGALFGWFRWKGLPAPSAGHWKAAFVSGGLMLLGGNGLLSWSEQHVPSGLAALLVATVPLWLVVLAWLGPGKERTGAREIAGLLLGLAGVGLLVSPSPAALDNVGTDARGFLTGALAILAGSAAWAVGSLYNRRAPLPSPPLYATAITMLAGGFLLVLAGLATGEPARLDPVRISLASAGALLYLIVFGSLIAFSAYTWLLRVSRPVLVGTYAYVNPVVAVLLGWAVASEPLDGRTLGAAVVILASVILVHRARTRSRRAASREGPGVVPSGPRVELAGGGSG
ncbi:MAG: drug/metabolite exporter YedA [Gemmatimonadota bacterium]